MPSSSASSRLLEHLRVDSSDWTKIYQLLFSPTGCSVSNDNNKLIQNSIDKNGLYILHYACWKQAPYDFIKELIGIYPEAVGIKGKQNLMYPLHYACCYHPLETVIQLLVETYPKALEEQDHESYPLHKACRNNQSSPAVIQYLISKYPQALREKDDEGYYPLHVACRYYNHHQNSESVIQLLLAKYQGAIKIPLADNGRYPLHIACRYEQSVAVIQLLINAFPPAVKIQDDYRWYPFHLVCRIVNEEHESLLQLLYTTYPDAMEERVNDMKYPLHIVCHNNQTETVIRFVLTSYPRALRTQDQSKEWYPFHYVCGYCTNVSIVQYVLTEYPEAVQQRDSDGLYPLHIACRRDNNPSLPIIQLLLTSYPDALRQKDHHGSYPLHYACQVEDNRCSDTIIELLYTSYPNAAYETDTYGYKPIEDYFAERRFEIYTWLLSEP